MSSSEKHTKGASAWDFARSALFACFLIERAATHIAFLISDETRIMANSIRNNAEFRALLTRKGGATGSELQACTGRAYVYSTWSLRCMETDKRELWTQKEGKETRYMLRVRKIAPVSNDVGEAAIAA